MLVVILLGAVAVVVGLLLVELVVRVVAVMVVTQDNLRLEQKILVVAVAADIMTALLLPIIMEPQVAQV